MNFISSFPISVLLPKNLGSYRNKPATNLTHGDLTHTQSLNQSHKPNHLRLSRLSPLLLATAGLGISVPQAIAQNSITLDDDTRQVQVDRNALDFQTGELGSTSYIPIRQSTKF
mgnify:FL=1